MFQLDRTKGQWLRVAHVERVRVMLPALLTRASREPTEDGYAGAEKRRADEAAQDEAAHHLPHSLLRQPFNSPDWIFARSSGWILAPS